MATTNEVKLKLIELLQSLEGLPKNQRQQFKDIIARLKKSDIVITKDQYQTIQLFVAAMFCGAKWPNFPMTNKNKKTLEDASGWLNKPETKLKSTRRK